MPVHPSLSVTSCFVLLSTLQSAHGSLLVGLVNQPSGTNDQVVVYDAAGNITAVRSLTGGPNTSSRIRIAYGDVLSTNPGNELIVLRQDNRSVEVYGDPLVGSGDLARLGFGAFQFAGNRNPASIDVAEITGSHAGLEIVSVTVEQSLIYTYTSVPASGTYNRVGWSDIATASAHDESSGGDLVALAVGDINPGNPGLEFVTIAENGWIEAFIANAGVNGGSSSRFAFGNDNAASLAIKVGGDGSIYTLAPSANPGSDDRSVLRRFTFDGTSSIVPQSSLLLGAAGLGNPVLVDFVIVPEPATLGFLMGGGCFLLASRRGR